jgi:hypothetical protein
MPEPRAEPTKAAHLAQQIVEILAQHDLETQERAMKAVALLLGHSTGALAKSESIHSTSADDHSTLGEFFDRGEKLKPADYAQLCAAFHYSQHGPVGFSLEDIRLIGSEAGVVLPDRLDKTFKVAAYHGKKLFQSAGRAAFKPTAAARLAFGERWGVKPGRRSKPNDQQQDEGRS